MRKIDSLNALPPIPKLACIINCGTKWVSTLALASTITHTDYPVLLIDCDSNADSRRHFAEVANRYRFEFYWLEWPLRPHGVALDSLFRGVSAELILLVNSDLEILTRRVVDTMSDALVHDGSAYGSGFLHRFSWLGPEQGFPAGAGRYSERMWIPLVLLRTDIMRHALNRGVSFSQRRRYIEFPGRPMLSRLLAYRFWLPLIRHWRPGVASSGENGNAMKQSEPTPALVEYDTGAEMHGWLTTQGHRFVELNEDLWGDVHHFHGVSRAHLPNRMRALIRKTGLLRQRNETSEAEALAEVRNRLSNAYGIDMRS